MHIDAAYYQQIVEIFSSTPAIPIEQFTHPGYFKDTMENFRKRVQKNDPVTEKDLQTCKDLAFAAVVVCGSI
jgi:hypothetical protein